MKLVGVSFTKSCQVTKRQPLEQAQQRGRTCNMTGAIGLWESKSSSRHSE